jgi:hypothetical protein
VSANVNNITRKPIAHQFLYTKIAAQRKTSGFSPPKKYQNIALLNQAAILDRHYNP